MKKFTSLIIAIMMLLYALPYNALAESKSDTPTISVENTEAHHGDTVDVDISISNNPGIISLDLGIAYNTNSLELTAVTRGNALLNAPQSSTTFSPEFTYNPYKVVWVTTATHNIMDNGVIVTLSFAVKSNANMGQSLIDITCNSSYNVANFPVSFNVADGYVNITETKSYDVRFLDWDNTVLSEQTVKEGEAATAPASPIREGHRFTGWDKDFSSVTEDMDIHAQYDILKYSVVFKDWDGTVLSSQQVAYGQAATAPANPSREGHMFVCWDNDFSNITHDLTVTAVYSVIRYSVYFADWNGTVLKHQYVAYGSSAIPPTPPAREGYTFTGWDKDYTNITGDITITALYEINTYIISYFVDGELYDTQSYEYGAEITPLDEPVSDGEIFSGWSTIPQTMPAHNLSVYGTFQDAHTVVFEDWDGTVLSSQLVVDGGTAIAPADPTRTGYEFTGWDKPLTNITENTVITAQYELLTFKVTFLDYDNSLIAETIVGYGQAAPAPQVPGREGYRFIGWDKDISCITSDLTVIAQYEIMTYTVTFVNYDGSILSTVTINHGEAAEAPEVPERQGYDFVGWDTDFTCVTSNLTVTALFEKSLFTVTFVDYDGTVLKTEKVEYGGSATAPEAPQRDGYIFKGWDKSFENIIENTVVTAVYNKLYTVTFIDSIDGSVINTQSVEEGTDAIAPTPPTHNGYAFVGWDKSFTSVSSDLVINAIYESTGVLGDVNMDGNINTADAVTILRHCAAMLELDSTQYALADANRDGKVNTADAVTLLRLAAGLIPEL